MKGFLHVRIWRIQDAPEEYKRFCPAGWLQPDSDNIRAVWLAYVPPNFGWAPAVDCNEYGCEVFDHQLDGGGYIAVGGHYRWCQHEEASDLPADSKRVIRFWHYGNKHADVPVPYTDDADWVAQVPRELVGSAIAWLESGTSFGCSGVDVHQLPDGGELRIGCHA